MRRMLIHRLIAVISIIGFSAIMAFAETITKGKVTIKYEPLSDGSVKVEWVRNEFDKNIEFIIDNNPSKRINAGSSWNVNAVAHRIVKYDFTTSSGETLWRYTPVETPVVEEPAPVVVETTEENNTTVSVSDNRPSQSQSGRTSSETPANRPENGYVERMNRHKFFGNDVVLAYTEQIENLCRGLELSNNKPQFIIDNDIELLLKESKDEISWNKSNLASTAQDIIGSNKVEENTMTLIVGTLNDRLKTREEAYNKLKTAVSNATNANSATSHGLGNNIVNYAIVLGVLALVIILVIVVVRIVKSKGKKNSNAKNQTSASLYVPDDNPTIVIKRRTTSMLKKLNIDDVIGNPAYLEINTSDFTPDSAVNKIYIKNTCIKEIYNLYAEDLRNTNNPKEDGCMVLGRWIRDDQNDTYDVSLEEVVFPGDDAVFKEYELNFGGKIKLRIVERLRKLRRDTGLQYDLVCWVHSHPGLGVFFSNSDVNVQTQLKHSQHPNFLVAFVVDILTSNQEMGIFTFRKDGSMNSKGDLLKMHSLEEMYKWALQSERCTFSHDDYYNVLKNAKIKLPSCKGVELNNNSIIDLTQILIRPETGIVGWAIGTTVENEGKREFVVSSIVGNAEKPVTGAIGCLINIAHMSYPTILRLISLDIVNLSFVMAYSSKNMSLTTLPIINGELLSDEQFYGDVNIDDLKIWTRRKR